MSDEADPAQPITFTLELCGRLTTIAPGVADLELGTDAGTPLGPATRLAARLTFADGRSFQGSGTVTVAGRDALAIATSGDGHLDDTPHAGVRHGTAVLHVTGLGALSGAHGRLTSNFVVTGDGRVTDRQVLVLFARPHHTHTPGGTA
jgi:hypothetical protein